MKKVGKTTRPFRYDINQIPGDCTVEVMNRLKGLDLVDRVPEERWMEVHNTVQGAVSKIIPRKRNARRQSGFLRWPYKELRREEKQKTRETGKENPTECRVPENK